MIVQLAFVLLLVGVALAAAGCEKRVGARCFCDTQATCGKEDDGVVVQDRRG